MSAVTYSLGEEGVMEGLLGGQALGGVVLEQAGEELVAFGAEGGERGLGSGGGCR